MAETPRMATPDPASNLYRTRRSTYLPYACAILSTALALLVRVLLTPSLGEQFPFATAYFAVTITAWYGGWRPALLATTLGYLGAVYFVIPPYHTFMIHGLVDYIGAGIFFFVSLTSSLFSQAQHNANAHARASAMEAHRQETVRRKAEAQQRFLAEASSLLASSLDYQTTLRSVAQLVVPHLADWCVVHLLDDDDNLELVTAIHVDPTKVEAARESSRRYPPRKDEQGGLAAVARTGKSEWLEIISDEVLRATAQDDAHYRMLAASGMRSYLCVALLARGKILGTVTFIGGVSGHRYNADSLPVAEELARRAAVAIDNARLYAAAQREIEERRQLAAENVRLYQSERERSEQLTLAIQEVHHRVKNNLQAVSALLEMQIDEGTVLVPVETVQDSLSQIKTIALVHDLLAHDKPIGKVNVALVLTNLAELLSSGMRTGEHPLPIRVEAAPVWLSTKAATSLALAINELLTNAAKHNTIYRREYGTCLDAIEVSLQRHGDDITVSVQDHGPGFAPHFDPITDAHIGLQLVLTLVEHDLHGAIAFSNRADSTRTIHDYQTAGNGEPVHGGRVEIRFSEQSIPE